MEPSNKLGTCTVSLGFREHHDLENKLKQAAEAGLQAIDLYVDDWLVYLSKQPGYSSEDPWAATPEHVKAAERIGSLCKELALEIVCLQPLIDVEGLQDPKERAWAEKYVKSTFPFLRAFGTDTVFMTSYRSHGANVSTDFNEIAADLALFGDWAKAYSDADGGPMLRIGYEALSWGTRINRWRQSWDVVQLANRPNVGIVFDTFNLLAVEYADPYNADGHGRLHATEEESMDVVRASMKDLVTLVDPDKIYVVQIADAERMDPKVFKKPTDPSIPLILPWSRGHRLFPCEYDRGAYLPVAEVIAAILATGYSGPLTAEVFNNSLFSSESDIVRKHADRTQVGLSKMMEEVETLLPRYRQIRAHSRNLK